jgi:hypothetical protein
MFGISALIWLAATATCAWAAPASEAPLAYFLVSGFYFLLFALSLYGAVFA